MTDAELEELKTLDMMEILRRLHTDSRRPAIQDQIDQKKREIADLERQAVAIAKDYLPAIQAARDRITRPQTHPTK